MMGIVKNGAIIKTGMLLCLLLSAAACSDSYLFKPYDYKNNQDASVSKQKSPYSLGLHGKRLVFKKEFPVQP